MKSHSLFIFCAALISLLTATDPAFGQGMAFTYQGRLNDGTNPANGDYDLRFTIYDAVTGGNVIGSPITNAPTGANNGLFTVALDFGADIFTGPGRWLDIGVRTNGCTNDYCALLPRQPLTAAPYAITAGNLTGNLPVGQLNGTVPLAQLPVAVVTNNGSNVTLSGAFTGDGGGLTNLNAATVTGLTASNFWQTGGNNAAAGQFLGTTNNQPLELNANGGRALRLEPGGPSSRLNNGIPTGAPNVIGGSSANFVVPGIVGATIAGGGATNYLDSAYTNCVGADFGTIGGGYNNTIQTNALLAVIGGGFNNTIQTNDGDSTIGGGENNLIQNDAYSSTIGGGSQNQIQTNAYASTIGGGSDDQILTGSHASVIGGGYNNTIQSNSGVSIIAGGGNHTIQANSFYSTISGGVGNTIQSGGGSTIGGGGANTIQNNAFSSTIAGGNGNTNTGYFATIPGGDQNVAGQYAFAAGHRAKANHKGSFVWADSNDNADFTDTANNQFDVRAGGGVLFTGGFGGVNQSVSWVPGSGSWSFTSDRNTKENFKPVDALQVLEKVAQLPLMEWNYIGYGDLHVGPMAQDFHAAFPFNENDKLLNSADVAGVSLAAIQGLNQKLEEKDAKIKELEERLLRLEKMLSISAEKR